MNDAQDLGQKLRRVFLENARADVTVEQAWTRIGQVALDALEGTYEEIYVVSQTRDGGKWSKLVKSQERWWYSAEEAQRWLDEQPDWFRDSNKVFKMTIRFDVERVTQR